ncbi:MAG: prolyl oligopeptidase family serine peptidase [Chloroflexota bacterium]|nr:prolyl oligopeptidase family serine peptidase [Chloroflexota bacterium]
MKRMRFYSIVLVLGFLLTGCGQGMQISTPPVDVPPGQDLLPFADESQHLYEQNLHRFDYDQNAPLQVQEEREWRENGNTWYDITYTSAGGRRASATLIVPDGRGPFAGLVVLHTMPAEFLNVYANWGAVVILVEAVFPSLEDDGYPTFTAQDRDGQIQVILDLRRAIDLLIARPDVDPDRLAYLGVSAGGATGGLLAGIEDRLRAYVLIVGDGGWVTHFTDLEEQETFFGVDEEQKPWIAAMWPIEAIHYVGHATPAALLFQNVTRDTLVDPLKALQYQQAGSEPKEVVWYDSVHWPLNEQVFQDNGRWLQQHIGPGKMLLLPVPNYRGFAIVFDRLLLAWLILVASSLSYFGYSSTKGTPMRWERRMIWLLAIAVLGPFGLAVFVIWHRRTQCSPRQAA